MKKLFPEDVLSQHIAVLGKTGSGKTSTAKLAVEQVIPEGARVCVLDPIKSDWWGLTSSADGKRAGLPFHILGGPRGHVPLHERAGKAIGELVATGALPHSIIDMADFPPGGQAHFFVDFAPALLRRMRGVVYLVIEEAHLFAPKERSGVGAENMSIHWAKTLATAGRSKGIRLVLVTQRTQALHNALLGSCDTIIAHRLTAPADQDPVVKWLKANTDAATRDKVAGSLASLRAGQGWICSGEAKLFELTHFPGIKTFDNTATPTGDGDVQEVKTAAVDVDKLRSVIGDAVKEAEAADPKLLRNRIAQLERELAAKAPAASPSSGISEAEVAKRVAAAVEAHAKLLDRQPNVSKALVAGVEKIAAGLQQVQAELAGVSPAIVPRAKTIARTERQREATAAPGPVASGITAPQQRILDVLASLEAFGVAAPNKAMVAAHAGVSPTSGGYFNNLGRLRASGLIDYPAGGTAALTDAGREAANKPDRAPTLQDLHGSWLRIVSAPQAAILSALLELHPRSISKDELADRIGVSRTSGGYFNNLGHLRTIGAIEYPQKGAARAADILFPK